MADYKNNTQSCNHETHLPLTYIDGKLTFLTEQEIELILEYRMMNCDERKDVENFIKGISTNKLWKHTTL